MYKGTDRDELTNSVTDLKEAIKELERVKELISGTCIDCKEITLDEVDDLIRSLGYEVEDMDEAMTEANAEEEAEELHDYWRAVV